MPLSHPGRRTPDRAARPLQRRRCSNIQSDDEPLSGSQPTNFSVVRLKRDVLRRSSIGAMYTGRSVGPGGGGRNDTYGVDGTFAFFDNLAFNTYWARTRSTRRSSAGDDTSYRAADGLRRRPLRRSDGAPARRRPLQPGSGVRAARRHAPALRPVRFSPRPRSIKQVRKFVVDRRRSPTSRTAPASSKRGPWTGSSPSSSRTAINSFVRYTDAYEFLPRPFQIAPGVTLPVGGYDFANLRAGFNFGKQRPVSGNVSVEQGTFYNGHKTTFAVSGGRDERLATAVGRADRVRQLGRSAGGRVHDHAGRLARHLHDDATDVRERAAPVQLRATTWWPPTCACAGSISPAASCSWCSTNSGTRWAVVFLRSPTAQSSSRSTGCSGSSPQRTNATTKHTKNDETHEKENSFVIFVGVVGRTSQPPWPTDPTRPNPVCEHRDAMMDFRQGRAIRLEPAQISSIQWKRSASS